MTAQLDIFTLIIEPGLYECSRPWTNELGHRWRVGEQLFVEEHIHASHATCYFPKDKQPSQRFHLSTDRLLQYFTPYKARGPLA